MHFHGYNFYVGEQGFNNYKSIANPTSFNLEDPTKCNTIIAPMDGWVAIRLKVDALLCFGCSNPTPIYDFRYA
jgi:hypothetical protein